MFLLSKKVGGGGGRQKDFPLSIQLHGIRYLTEWI